MPSQKLDGFDKYDVKHAAQTLIDAAGYSRRPKFYKAVKKEVRRMADDAIRAAKEKKEDADKIKKG